MNMKKLVSMVLALIMMLSMMAPAMAATLTINSATNVSVAGKTFNAYKILDLKVVNGNNVYTVPEALDAFYADEFDIPTTDPSFDYKVVDAISKMTSNSDALFAFASRALAAAKAAGITAASVTGTDGASSVKFTDLTNGYYIIEDVGAAVPISALMLDSTSGNDGPTITLKADKPELVKKIDGATDTDPNTSGLVDANNTSIGDKVPYVLTSKVPDMIGYTKYFYVVTDTLSKGLTFNNDVAITIGEKTLVKDTDYTVSATTTDAGETVVKIVFIDFIQYKEQKDAEIKITYSATVNADAEIGVEGNPNKVTLEYSNNPNIVPDGENEPDADDPTGTTPEDKTYTYVTEIELNKVDAANNALTGAIFTLEGVRMNHVLVNGQVFVESENGAYYGLTDGTYTQEAPDGDAADTNYVKDDSGAYVKYDLTTVTKTEIVAEDVKLTAAVNAEGRLVFTGLAAGEYTITEIKAPDGYNLLDKPIKVTIGWNAPSDLDTSVNCTWTYTWENANGDGNTVTVVNQAGATLPETGAQGTRMIYIVGGILVAAAAILLITKRRMNAAE